MCRRRNILEARPRSRSDIGTKERAKSTYGYVEKENLHSLLESETPETPETIPISETVLHSAMEELRQMQEERALQVAAGGVNDNVMSTGRGVPTITRKDCTAKSFL